MLYYFRKNTQGVLRKNESIVAMENCYRVVTITPLTSEEEETLKWLLRETFEPENFADKTFLSQGKIIEVGTLLERVTPWSTNAVSICHSVGLTKVVRIECSRRFLVDESKLTISLNAFVLSLRDPMTEMNYPERLDTFETGRKPEPVFHVPVMEEGRTAIEKINRTMGLGLDDWDIDYYYNLFVNDIGRNPTNVECFDLAQSNSEHSRHWFFKGKIIIDDIEMSQDLMTIVSQALKANPRNSVIAFEDNSSAIDGYVIDTIVPENPGKTSRFVKKGVKYHIIFTAETHNFPSGVAPFPGAETGTGGRIRDVQATGRGGLVVAGTAAYCVGNLLIPGYELPWEDKSFAYPSELASPLEIEIQASNGASDYGNKFGEPVVLGFTRSFGLRLPDGERREWRKPIMFTGGIGQMDARHTEKGEPKKGMLLVKVGGPAYRIGVGGGANSSVIQGSNTAERDANAVQRGDAEMEQKMNRVLRACIERGDKNPIVSVHDQGAGGNNNVTKEIVVPEGVKIDLRKIIVGDHTLSTLEICGAEYQEQNALLIWQESADDFEVICKREKVPVAFIGTITGDGYFVIHDEVDGSTPVNLPLDKVLAQMPQKTFRFGRVKRKREPLKFPEKLTMSDALEHVLRLLSVGSKRFLTNKVDRSVTGLIARQQCCGPLQLTVADYAIIAQSHFGFTGAVTSIGEQPIKGLINPGAMARLSVAEAITNMAFAKVSAFEDISASGNWMWPAKLLGEGADLYDAAVAMRDLMIALRIKLDGGKDSLSMAAQVKDVSGKTETVKAPGALVISAYCTMPDITKAVTPDIKNPGSSRLLHIDLAKGKHRLGGTAIAQCFKQIGDECPDVEDPELLRRAFEAIQELIERDLILSGHDVSDGGLITTLLEMAFSGNCGFSISSDRSVVEWFAEEVGLVIECPWEAKEVFDTFKKYEIPFEYLGFTLPVSEKKIIVKKRPSGEILLDADMRKLLQLWEETSYQLERLQCNPECAEEEKENNSMRAGLRFSSSFIPESTPLKWMNATDKPKIAIIREEGSNGDREMAAAFYQAGFECHDVTMTDLLFGATTLDKFRGIAFVGGFSYADVLDSAKGWAGMVRFNPKLWEQFERFYHRLDTFSFGVCNGCQLMALLGWIPFKGLPDIEQPRFIHNKSRRFESRWTSVKISKSPAMMLDGMEGSRLGVWLAHGEGRVYFPDEFWYDEVKASRLDPLHYVDDGGFATERYPFNPNGSRDGVAALCSPDGRHLAMMPHPERAFLNWQWEYLPQGMDPKQVSPWMKVFQNARRWCEETK